VELARELGSPALVRALNNVATTLAILGELDRSFERYAEARQAAERFGDAAMLRWLQMSAVLEAFWTGRWDDALARADAFITACETSPHYLEPYCRAIRGRIRLARGDRRGAREDGLRAVELARRANDAQVLYPALAYAARAAEETGEPVEAGRHADELIDLVGERAFLAGEWIVDLAETLCALGRADDFTAIAERLKPATRWLDGARASSRGDFVGAADAYARIGSRPDEAVARASAARALVDGGREAAAAAQLERALAFYRSVGAAAYLRQAEPLLTRSS
jgi:tetratricopeptide (TPR) repeat protein